jgi:hypothetical protein
VVKERWLPRRTVMRHALAGLLVLLSVAPAISAKPKHYTWRDATVVKIASENSGAAAVPVGSIIVAVPLHQTFYWFRTDDGMVYVAASRNLLNVTLNGSTTLRFDDKGRVDVLDDGGKYRRLTIVQRIAPQK